MCPSGRGSVTPQCRGPCFAPAALGLLVEQELREAGWPGRQGTQLPVVCKGVLVHPRGGEPLKLFLN